MDWNVPRRTLCGFRSNGVRLFMPFRTVAEIIAGGQIVHIAPESTILEACVLMKDRQVGAVLVMEHGKLLGLLSERDVVERLVVPRKSPANTSVESLMTRELRTALPDTPAREALHILQEEGFRHLPVVGEDGEVYGVVSLRDFLGAELITGEEEHEFEMRVYEGPTS
jgi:CBS domain-containing protein